MSVVRRGARLAGTVSGLLLAGVLVGAPAAFAQEAPGSDTGTVVVEPDPCAPGPDGQVPLMCQGGAAPEPAPEPDPDDPCAPGPDGQAPEMCQGGEVLESGAGTTGSGTVRPAAGTLPRTGPSQALVAAAGVGVALLVVGGFTVAAARRPVED